MPHRSTRIGAAGQFNCYGGPIQQWHDNTSTGLIPNVNSGKCLEVLYRSTADLAAVGGYDCHGGNNQKWWWS